MDKPDRPRTTPQPDATIAKTKPYLQPRLVRHGRISQMTAGYSIIFPFPFSGPGATG